MRISIINKFKRVYELFVKSGFDGVRKQIVAYVHHHIKEQWRFIYLELDLRNTPYSLPDMDDSMLVRRAKPKDIEKIKIDLYPYMEEKQEYDKRYMECLGKGDAECFIAEKEGRFVSYFMVFKDATQSPLIETPFDKKMITGNDAYLGNAFTVPDVRGMWIMPHILLSIIDYLQKESSAIRILLLVHEDTPGAVGFFRRLGFSVIENAVFEGYYSKITKFFNKKTKT
ncbi:MAG: GNAT superfamily N-acetyltransferase [bacterium]|jgi:GNAT superfamily N-acetyltransferase